MSGGYVAVTKSSLTNDFDPDNVDNLQFYKPPKGGYPLKSVCDCLRRQSLFGKAAIAFGVVFCVILIVVIAMSVKRQTTEDPKYESKEYGRYNYKTEEQKYISKEYGLEFYPEPLDHSVVINFRPMSYKTYNHYLNYLNGFLHDYSLSNQLNPDKFVQCNDTYAPADKVCKFVDTNLGKCNRHKEYGFHEGNPCILFILKLPHNTKPEPLPSEQTDLGDRWTRNNIGISCKGQAPEDEKKIGKKYVNGIPAIEYFPNLGFPTYFYRKLDTTEFLDPLVMVKFNTIEDHHSVNVQCTAWVQPVEGTKSEDFTAKFTFNIH